ncbi:MAG: PEP-CTERM sorting domain-containing protein [Verrucomicrobiales bacterium]
MAVANPFTWVLDTTAGAVNATTGENIIEVTRTGGFVGDDPVANGGWIQYDYLQLESQVIPEPTSVSFGLAALAFAGLFRRRR